MSFELIDLGASRSIPDDDVLREKASPSADIALVIGGDAAARARAVAGMTPAAKRLVAVELGTECLGFHIGENAPLPANVVGFARFRLGELPISHLVELVHKPATIPEALEAAKQLFESLGLKVAVCADVPGRIVDSLLRPYLNAAMRSVDEGLATPADLDQALRLGLGFPVGPIDLLHKSGIAAHFQISRELHEALGASEFVPARRARILAMRKEAGFEPGSKDGI